MALSPMMTQYLETKKENPDCLLFYRLGDFYEMFFEDAKIVSQELELTLTGKDCGLEERAPMCGVPYHAVEGYLTRLVSKGYKVAIAEQMEDPKLAKGLVKREVVRIVTPGTITSESALSIDKNNYLMGIVYLFDRFGIATVDISTGDFYVTEVNETRELLDEVHRFAPAEIICNPSFSMSGIGDFGVTISSLEHQYFNEVEDEKILKEHFQVKSMEELGLLEYPDGVVAAGAVMHYLYNTQKSSCAQIVNIKTYRTGQYMMIDASSRRNLELVETMRDKKKQGSLFGVLDKTKTAMGARLLRSYIEQPLIQRDLILRRQEAIEELLGSYIDREELREYLGPVYDLERLMGKISSESANTRDLLAFGSSIDMVEPIKMMVKNFHSPMLVRINEDLDSMPDLCDLIKRSLNDEDTPITLKEGNLLKDGYNEDVDQLRRAKTEGKDWLSELESREREKTQIKGLKIKFNKVFGYYFEVTNSYKNLVPEYFIRKQTLTNAERYTSEELKKLEGVILGAEDKLKNLEYSLFVGIRQQIAGQVERIQKTAKALAMLDVFLSLATVAEKNQYVRPNINEKGLIDIRDGRHPVVEEMMKDHEFISNDTLLDQNKNRMSIITGPNMAGKSTYMRQTAIIVLMAQMGSFIPASAGNIGICDRIFTRVGASDDLASGQSTFMVEMMEVANILQNATRQSLIILDEIGRGTSTFDGLSIAWAVVEHIANTRMIGAKTLFATHYHELSELEGTLSGVNNYCVSVKEQGEDIVFLRKIVRGGADKSYGIQVAKLAGVPESVLLRAKELVEELSGADIATKAREIAELGIPKKSRKPVSKPDDVESAQLSLMDAMNDGVIVTEIRDMDLNMMTPMDAMNTLLRLQNKIRNRI